MSLFRSLPPFRADVVGSYLRPLALKQARAACAAGQLSPDELRGQEDAAIRYSVQCQCASGLQVVTDGEFRRAWWHFDFFEGLEGVEGYDADQGIQFSGVQTKARNVRVVGSAAVGQRERVVVVEGYTDVMAAHLAGVTTAVATCGTAFGADHASLLRRYIVDDDTFGAEVIFTFDGDAAGQKAALRAFEGDQRFVAQTFIAVSPDNMDPCELRLARGDAAVRELVAGRTPLFEFAIRSAIGGFDLSTAEGRVGAVRRAAPYVARIRDAALRPEYARLLSGWVGVPEDQVRQAVAAAGRAGGHRGSGSDRNAREAEPTAPATPGRAPRPDPRNPQLFVERESLKCALQVPQLVGEWYVSVQASSFRHPRYAEVHSAVATAFESAGESSGRSGGREWVEAVLAACPDDTVRDLVTELAVEPLVTAGEPDARYATSIVARLLSDEAARRVADLKRELGQLDQMAQADRVSEVLADVMQLEAYRRELAAVGQDES